MITDGYGDAVSPQEALWLEEQARIKSWYRASTHHTAKAVNPHQEHFEDLVQEGVVQAWVATREVRADAVTYGAVAARNRINGLHVGKYPMLGSEAEQGKRLHDQSRQTTKREGDFEGVSETLVHHGNPYVAVEQKVDMDRALVGLDPRDVVIAKMVSLDLPWEAISDVTGLAPVSVKNRWLRVVRPNLREVLRAA